MNEPEVVDFERPDLYFNRELSQVAFNRRVLELSKDQSLPLLERLKFLCISSSNLDEFFEVRVAALIQKVEAGSVQTDVDNIAPTDLLRQVSEASHELVAEQYRVLNEDILPSLRAERVRFLRRSEWNRAQANWLRDYFHNELLPVLSPIGLDPAHPFPRILNKSLNFIVRLRGRDAFGRDVGQAIVQAPRALPRIVRLPEEVSGSGQDFVFLSSIIHAHVEALFPGMQVLGCYQFRVTRNSNLFVDEEEVDNLLRALEGELPARRYGDAVRLEVAHNCPRSLIDYLLQRFEMDEKALFTVNGPVNLSRLMALPDLIDRPDLKFPGITPHVPRRLASGSDLFEEIRAGDILLHHPYESFVPLIDLLRQAARDPGVLAIKQTLYRTGAESAVVDALVSAARAGKEVTVVVELRARFDEADNIGLAQRLEEAGAHVVYGVVGYKTHSKMLLIVRREAEGLRHYVHLGTGNYHPKTARLYTDYGLLTCNASIGDDVRKLFLQLTSLGKPSELAQVLDAPFKLYDAMLANIEREAQHARAGKAGRIIAKMNGLVEPGIIKALYAASQAGVQIDLIVRGMCCLRPGVEGVSENIRVRSIMGRFLEHSRVYYFANHNQAELYLSSADWMERNLFNRVEAAFPLIDDVIFERVLADLETCLADNSHAWELQADGCYLRRQPANAEPVLSAQARMLEDVREITAT
ncbi:MAG: polyphosphate kinase 1 [Nevskiales bacterium]